jgi:hypothetical protein
MNGTCKFRTASLYKGESVKCIECTCRTAHLISAVAATSILQAQFIACG